jgi:hypothetical protein
MKKVTSVVIAIICTLLIFAPNLKHSTVHAQQGVSGTLVQNSPTELRSCTSVHNDAAVNNTLTLTIPAPPSGLYIYMCGLDLSISNDATGAVASTNLKFTSTNFGSWTWEFSSVNTASSNVFQVFNWIFLLKAPVAGTAVTIISPAANLHAAYSMNGYYYYAP